MNEIQSKTNDIINNKKMIIFEQEEYIKQLEHELLLSKKKQDSIENDQDLLKSEFEELQSNYDHININIIRK